MKRPKTVEETAVILCGGRGRRLGSQSERLPKPLARVRGKPILWYILLSLHQAGFRHFVLPLGYRGGEFRKFFASELAGFDARVELIETGEATPIGRRLSLARHAITSADFLLVNGDTLFDFDVAALIAAHKSSGAELTLTSCRVTSQYGLLLIDGKGRLRDFVSDAPVTKFVVDGCEGMSGLVNAGIAVLARHTLDKPGVANAPEFEQHLYRRIIVGGGARHNTISGFWHAIDTAKDLEIANSLSQRDPRARGTRLLAKKLTAYARKLGVVRRQRRSARHRPQ